MGSSRGRPETTVRRWRTSRRLSLVDWARIHGVSIGHMSEVERGIKGAGRWLRDSLARRTRLSHAAVDRALDEARESARQS